MEFVETFPYVIKYQHNKETIVANALSQRYALLSTLNAKILVFEYIKDSYVDDSDFGNVFNAYEKVAFGKFFRHDIFSFWENKLYSFWENKLYVPKCSLHDLLIIFS